MLPLTEKSEFTPAIEKLFKTCAECLHKEYSKLSSSKIPSTRKSPRKRIFQEDEYADFTANDTIGAFNNIPEKKYPVGETFLRYDDHNVWQRHITK